MDLFQRKRNTWKITLLTRALRANSDQQEHQHKEKLSPFTKRILIVDDHPDVILTFKKGLEAENEYIAARFSSKFMLMMILY